MIDPYIQSLLEAPIGNRDLQCRGNYVDTASHIEKPEAKEAARRASKTWLPEGRRSNRQGQDTLAAFHANQIDLEDAVEAAGGCRGSAGR